MLAKRNFNGAIDISKKLKPRPFHHSGLFQVCVYKLPFNGDVAAQAYQHKGELDKAIAEYECLIAPEPGQSRRWLIHPLYHYRLAKLYEQKKWEGKAIERYEKFLQLWKDADPDLPEVVDAQARVAALKNY